MNKVRDKTPFNLIVIAACLYTHLPKVSGQNVDHVNFRNIFMCFTQKYSKTNKKTRLFVLSNHTLNVRNCIFPLIFIT